MASYLDKAGLTYLWSKLKPLFEGKADASHEHDAGEITSGTFSTARIPGLGASKITSGTFAVSRGGTGKSSVTSGNYLVGNGTSAMTEKTPAEVLAHIGAAASGHGHDSATGSAAGFMSATDKAKLDGIAAGANAYTHPASHPASMITGLATVATSGSYNDLSNKPTIPAAYTHPNSGVTAGTYRSVTVNAQGHVTGGTNPTTLAGYGITDAAASGHKHAAGDITSGTFSSDRLPTVPISKGGTGATTADAALANLGVNSITNAEIDELMV